MSEAILVILVLFTMIMTICLYKMFNKRGLYFSLVLINLITFVLSFKISYILKMNINTGIIPFTGMLTIINLFIIKYGTSENKNLLTITLYSNIIFALILGVMNYFIPAVTETISINMEETFKYNYKIIIIYPFIITLTEYLSIKLFNLVNKIQSNIIINSILTYAIIGIIFPIIMYLLTYINILDIKYSLFLGISTYILGLILTIFNSISLSIINKKKVI